MLLWLMIGLLLLIAMTVVFVAFKGNARKVMLIAGLVVVLISLPLYYYLGNNQGLHNAQLLQNFDRMMSQGEGSDVTLQKLVTGLQRQLAKHPKDPITWALLGRVYLTLQDYSAATQSFAKAHALLPEDPELLIDYVTADFLAQKGVMTPALQLLLQQVEALPPSLEGLSLLANVALSQGNTDKAIVYWQAMQVIVPKDSALYHELALTIEQARKQ